MINDQYVTITAVVCQGCGERIRIIPALVKPDDVNRTVEAFALRWRNDHYGHKFGTWPSPFA